MNDEQRNGGLGVVSVLTIVFVVLKLCNLIDWSWWWVLSPLWITAGIVVVILLIAFTLCIVKSVREYRKEKQEVD